MEALDLDAPLDETEQGDPACTFTLGGQTWDTVARDDVPLWVFTTEALPIVEFFQTVIAPGQRQAFTEMLVATGTGLTLRRVTRAVNAIKGELLGFPTTQPAPSQAGTRRTAKKSAAGSSRKATPRQRSA